MKQHNWRVAFFDEVSGERRKRCVRCGMIDSWPGGKVACVGFGNKEDRAEVARARKAARELRSRHPWL